MKNLHLRKKKSLFRSYSTSEIAENTHSDKSCFVSNAYVFLLTVIGF